MATVGRSNIEITADTSRARRSLGDFFRQAENSGRRLASIFNAFDPFSNIVQGSSNATGGLNNLNNAADNLNSNLNNLGGQNNLNQLNGDLTDAEHNMDDLHQSTGDVGDGLDDASREMRDFGDAAQRESRNAEGSLGKLGDTAKKIGGVLVAVFAVDQIKDFATDLAATAGAAEASKAQFSTVFGDMEGEAAKRLSAIGGEATILENRMKDSFTKIAAFAKTGGMDTADSLDLADRSLRAVADSAAFYDRSLEDTTESLQSFLKGNFENDAALGLSSTETTRNAAANKLYGKSFKDLSEAQKQLTSLQMVEDANKLTGALGQASRESDGWENVVGNMTQAWTDFKAGIGAPVLSVAVKALKGMTAAVQALNTEAIGNGIQKAFDFIAGSIKGAKDAAQPLIGTLKTIRDVVKGLLTDDGEKGRNILKTLGFSEEMIMRMDGYAASFAGFRGKMIDFVNGFKQLFIDDGSVGRDLLASIGVSTAIIAKLDYFAMNFSAFRYGVADTFKAIMKIFQGNRAGGFSILESLGFTPDFILKIDSLVAKIKGIAVQVGAAAASIGAGIGLHGPKIYNSVKKFLIDIWPSVKSAVSGIASFVGNVFMQIAKFWEENGAQIITAVSNVFNGIMKVIQFVMPVVLAIIKMVWANIKGVISGALDVIMGAVKVFSGLFTGDFKKMWEGLKQMFMGAIEFIWNFVQLTFFGKILSGAKVFFLAFRGGFASLWTGIKALFTGGVGAAWQTIKAGWSQISSATTTVFKGIWTFLSGTFNAIKNVITLAVKGYFNLIGGGWTLIFNTTRTVFTTVFNFIKGIFNSIRTSVSGSVSSIFSKVRETWSALKTNTSGAFRDIFNGIKSRFTDIVNAAKALPGRIGDGIGAMASKVTSGVTKVINKLASTLGKGVNGVIGGINGVLEKIGIDDKNYIPLWTVPQYAQGTKGAHPGGLAMVNDGKGDNAGPELIIKPDGTAGMLKGKNVVRNFEKGTQVISGRNTRKLIAAIPKYDSGAGPLNAALGKGKELATHLWEGGKNLGKKAVNSAIDVFDYIKKPEKLLDLVLSNLGFTKPSGSGFIANMAKGGWNKVRSGAVDFVKSKLSDFGDDGGSAPGFGSLFGKSSSYGWRMHPILKKRIFHNGADYPAPSGTLIKAQAAGKVIQAAYHAIRGNFVKIKSGIMERIYQHNSRNLVSTGDMVRKGQGIGTVGSTGRSTGPHLHYEVKRNGQNINPQGFFKGGIVKAKQLAWVAEKGMEAIIPLVTNRSEGIDLWRRVGEHFGFNMDAILNPGAFNMSLAGDGQDQLQSMSAVGSHISQSFKSTNSKSVAQPIRLTVSIPLDRRVIAEETFEITEELIEQNKDIKFIGRGK